MLRRKTGPSCCRRSRSSWLLCRLETPLCSRHVPLVLSPPLSILSDTLSHWRCPICTGFVLIKCIDMSVVEAGRLMSTDWRRQAFCGPGVALPQSPLSCFSASPLYQRFPSFFRSPACGLRGPPCALLPSPPLHLLSIYCCTADCRLPPAAATLPSLPLRDDAPLLREATERSSCDRESSRAESCSTPVTPPSHLSDG